MVRSAKTLRKRRRKLDEKDLTAEEVILEDLFNDMYAHRGRVYRMNFFRGIFLGLGTFLGGTVIIAIIIALLSFLVQIGGGPGEFFKWLVDTIQNT